MFVRFNRFTRLKHIRIELCRRILKIMNKRLVVIAGLSLALIAIASIGVIVFMEIQQGKSEGLAYAKRHNKSDCVKAVIKGKRICTEASCFLNNRYFFQTCMNNARSSASLCKNVPTMGNLFQLEAWKNKQCQQKGRTDRNCHHIWQKVRNSCKAEKV